MTDRRIIQLCQPGHPLFALYGEKVCEFSTEPVIALALYDDGTVGALIAGHRGHTTLLRPEETETREEPFVGLTTHADPAP